MESLSLIDVASEDDLLIPADENAEDPEPSENHEMRKVSFFLESASIWEGENPVKVSKQAPETSESPELKRAKSGNINLRKSLAWDSAFFTSEGVLENEELAIVNSTFRKAEVCKLTGIQEDLRKSSDSTSTLNSETYALENLEVGLFDNLRASIQMSLGKDNKVSNGLSDVPCLGSTKKVGLLNKMKPSVNSKKDGVSKQQQQFTSREAVTGVKVGSGQSKSLSRPPRIVPKPMSTAPSSKAPAGSVQLKGNGVNRQSVVVPEKTNGNARSVTSRPNSLAKPSPGSRPGPISRPATKIPSRTTKTGLPPSNLGFSSKASPRSSIDSTLSSKSSSSATDRTRRSNSVESLGASSSTSSSHSASVPGTLSQSQHARPCSSSEPLTDAGSRCSKPSGLRMPSPKIGYFDAEKTQARGSNKISQPSLRKSLVKSTIGASNIAGGSKQKTAKSPTVRPAVQPAAENTVLLKTRSTSKSPNDGTRRASPMSMRQRKESGEAVAPSGPAAQRAAEKFDSPKTLSASKSPDGSTRRVSPASMSQRQEPAVTTDEDDRDMSLKSADGRVRVSKELLKREQETPSCSIDSVADKSEKENFLPAREANGMTQRPPMEV